MNKRKTKPIDMELYLIAKLYRTMQEYQNLFVERLCGQIGECEACGCLLYGENEDGRVGCIWNNINDNSFNDKLEEYLDEHFNRDDPYLIEPDRPYLGK